MELISKLIDKLLCMHNYKEKHTVSVYENEFSELPYKYKSIYICKKCGKLKRIYT